MYKSISAYAFTNYDIQTLCGVRKLLLHKREIASVRQTARERHCAIPTHDLFMQTARSRWKSVLPAQKTLYKRAALKEKDHARWSAPCAAGIE